MAKQFVVRGIPIAPDVDRLMTIAFEVGQVYRHEDLAAVIDESSVSGRYRSVISALKKRLRRERNLDLQSVTGLGYKVLDDNERVDAGIKDLSRSVRNVAKAADRMAAANTEKLDDLHRAQKEHGVRLALQLHNDGKSAGKQIANAAKVVTLPRPQANAR